MKNPTLSSSPRGFALVITLMLMILLTVVAVGLLSLSTISIRTSGQAQAMATARSNARLALMMALGDLQKSIGPDRAITANSEILDNSATPIKKYNTSGVWESWWDFDPNSSPTPDYVAQKRDRFRRWLVSSPDPTTTQSRDFATTAWSGDNVTLVGGGSLGAANSGPAQAVAGLVPVTVGKSKGAYAWHVADESLKARINLYRDPDQNGTYAQKRALLAGHRPDPSVMTGADGTAPSFLPTDLIPTDFKKAKGQSSKLLGLNQVELLDRATKDKVRQFRNDVTPYSSGLLTDVRRGGLKQDLSSVFELDGTLPTEFNNERLYASTHGLTGVSDPYWSTLAGYYNSFRKMTALEKTPELALSVPPNLALDPVTREPSLVTTLVPTTYFPGPVIAKVETIFSLVARPLPDIDWMNKDLLIKSNYDYVLDILYTPVVTLHNPYNINISFYQMTVEFKNVPIAFNFMFQAAGTTGFVSQSVTPGSFESINGMTSEPTMRTDKTFKIAIADWSSDNTTILRPIVMKPGQTLVCGPSMDTSKRFADDQDAQQLSYDHANTLTKGIKAKPFFTPGLGFELTALTIQHFRRSDSGDPGGSGPGWCEKFMLRDTTTAPNAGKGTDKFYVLFQAQKPKWHTDNATSTTIEAAESSFVVTAKLQANIGSPLFDYARLKFDYNSDSDLKKFFNKREYRYPPNGSYTAYDVSIPAFTTFGEQGVYMHPFAVLSAYARTTNGGVYETGKRIRSQLDSPEVNLLRDGRLAGKPFLFHNPSQANITINLVNEKPGMQSYELNLQPFTSKNDLSDNYLKLDGNRVPALTANTEIRGIKSGSYFELPTGPMQTIADFRRSNAVTSSYLPQFVQPVGNSSLHPLMSPTKVIENNSIISPSPLLDHSVLANHAFYDRFYFSTFATRGSEKPDAVFEKFMDYTTPLPSQGFLPHRANGQSVADVKAELFSSGKPSEEAYKMAAEYQLVQSPFNVNSTSVQSWKAVLAAMNKSEVATLWAKNPILESKASSGVPIFGMSLLNGGRIGDPAADAKADNAKTNEWNGYRELSDVQLTNLATEIVKQVRQRGPFLSMSEFVNRQVGPESNLSLSGALENAISDSEINKSFMLDNVTQLTTGDFMDTALYNYKTPAATVGNPAAGAPGWISQGDLLRILEPGATVRSDTFVIRVCGEAKDAAGAVTARAYAEAVVQRVPEYIDPANRPSMNLYTDTNATIANKTFGRRMNVVSFRWLSSNEI